MSNILPYYKKGKGRTEKKIDLNKIFYLVEVDHFERINEMRFCENVDDFYYWDKSIGIVNIYMVESVKCLSKNEATKLILNKRKEQEEESKKEEIERLKKELSDLEK